MHIKKAIFNNSRSMYRQFSNSVMMPGVFTCRMYKHMPTYRSGRFNPGLPGPSNATIQDWVGSSPVVRLEWFMVDINHNCSVDIELLNDPEECQPVPLSKITLPVEDDVCTVRIICAKMSKIDNFKIHKC